MAESLPSPTGGAEAEENFREPLQQRLVTGVEVSTRGGGWPAAMYSIFYIIGVIVVVLAVLSLLGLA
jgi:hypothetical protein